MTADLPPTTTATHRILVAGATGAIGRRLIPLLVGRGYDVVGLTRSPAGASALRTAGARAVTGDLLDPDGLRDALAAVRPGVVIHQVTSLRTGDGRPIGPAELDRTARIRDVGTANLVDAAVAAGARRIVAQSAAFLYAPGPEPHDEDDPLGVTDAAWEPTLHGVLALERHIASEPSIEGVVLRYGYLYGPGTGATVAWQPPGVHVDAAAAAAALAVENGTPGIYNVVDDDGPVANLRARAALGWDPSIPAHVPPSAVLLRPMPSRRTSGAPRIEAAT